MDQSIPTWITERNPKIAYELWLKAKNRVDNEKNLFHFENMYCMGCRLYTPSNGICATCESRTVDGKSQSGCDMGFPVKCKTCEYSECNRSCHNQ